MTHDDIDNDDFPIIVEEDDTYLEYAKNMIDRRYEIIENLQQQIIDKDKQQERMIKKLEREFLFNCLFWILVSFVFGGIIFYYYLR
jgi:hypothetical protein